MISLRNQVLIWVGLLLASILVLWVFRPILLPFVAGIVIAYLLNPLVSLVERIKVGRGWSTAIVLLFVLALIGGLMFLFVPLLISQVIGLAQRLPDYVMQLRALANEWLPQLNTWLGEAQVERFETQLTELLGNAPAWTATITAWLAQSGWSIINTLGVFIITPVVAFYLLLDWDSMVKGIDDLLPRDHRVEVRRVLNDIDRSIAAVFRGQGSVILVLCVYYASALSVVGLSFGLAIGIITGLLSFIPFVGFLTGLVLSMGIALVQFWPNWVMVTIVFATFMIGQFLEGNVLYPKLVGSSIGINPVWLMFALFAFALLFGFVGLLLAVPLSAIVAVLIRWATRKYKESALYLGRRATRQQAKRAAAAKAATAVKPGAAE
jgi:predicted PurR-regulated permease PerM